MREDQDLEGIDLKITVMNNDQAYRLKQGSLF
jgi:hypothetical protein